MAKILVLNGPNLNLIGEREPEKYGIQAWIEIEKHLQQEAAALGHVLTVQQSNHEGDLIDYLHETSADFVLVNAGAYTHTSIALRDAFSAIQIPFIELHLTNVYAREAFRHRSLLVDLAVGIISGFGANSYSLALAAADHYLKSSIVRK